MTLLAFVPSAQAGPSAAGSTPAATPPNPYVIIHIEPRGSELEIGSNPYAVAPEEAVSTPADDALATRTPERPTSIARDGAPSIDLLAAHAATRPAPASDDRVIVALDAALAGRAAPPEPEAAAERTGAPSRAEVMEAIAYVAPYIRQCVERQTGRVVHVRTTFAPSGRVSSAIVDVSSAHISPAERSCMARAARHARTPAFENERFDVSYPVRL